MEPMELKFVELHSPIFLAGTNMGLKLDPSKRGGLELTYFRDAGELHIKYKGEFAIVPTTNIVSMCPGKPNVAANLVTHPMVASIQSAQVETPYGHVHAGPGKGKVGK